ncbi:MAG: aminopeptidase P family protein [Actinobacteria bacterium]|nr:aminopeptidase P family protein [Actinomycetota bacterium]
MIEKKEFERRKQSVVDILGRNNLRAALIYYDEVNIGNGWYLSGWCPQFESGSILITDTGYAAILGGPESEPFAKMDSTIKETKNIPVFMVPDEEYPYAEITNFKEVFSEAFGNQKLDKIGIVGMGSIPYGVYRRLVDELGDVELIDITEQYEELRIIKSDYEIGLIRRSFEICDEAFKDLLANLKEGVTEVYLAGIAEGKMRMLGANWFGFKSIVAAGERSNGVVPTATERRLKNKEMVLLGISPRYQGYAAAAGYTTVVGGKFEKEQKDYLKMIAEAYVMTREMLKPGMIGEDNYKKVKKFFEDKGGYGKYIVCPFVHTIGLHEAEAPFFGPNSEDVLKPNMTVCIDVSLWGHPTFHGVRVETGFLITERGYEPFSPYMDKLIESLLDL